MPVKVLGQETEFHRFKLQPVAGKRSGTLQDLGLKGSFQSTVSAQGISGRMQLPPGRTQQVSRSRGRETLNVHSGRFCKL